MVCKICKFALHLKTNYRLTVAPNGATDREPLLGLSTDGSIKNNEVKSYDTPAFEPSQKA
jgi:hypothetical protein